MTLRFKSVVLILVVAALVCLAIWWARERLESWTQVPGEYSLNHGSLGTAQDISLEDASKECERDQRCKGFVFAPTLKGQRGMAFYKSEIRMDAKSPYALYNSFTVCKDGVDCGPGAKEMTRMKIPGSTVEFDLKSLTGQLAGPDPNPKQPDPKQPGPNPKQPDQPPPTTPLPNQPPAVTPVPVAPGSCPDPGCDIIVNEHNRVRAIHGVHEKLRWDPALQAIAQARADWNAANGKTGHDAVAAGIAPSAGPENAYSGIGFGMGPGGAPEMWANSVGHAPHVLGRNVTAVGCATNPGAGFMPSICVYDAWGKICGDPTICAAPSNNCRCHIDERGGGWGCC